jgi:peptide/nickel transport system permease protein
LKTPGQGSRRFGSISKFLGEFKRYKLGVLGLVIIAIFAVLATFAPVLTPYNPIYTQNLASPFSVPSWAKVFPQYSNLPVNSQLLQGTGFGAADLGSWKIAASVGGSAVTGSVTYAPVAGGLLVNFTAPSFVGIGTKFPVLVLNQTVSYPWDYACHYGSLIAVTPQGKDISNSNLTVNEYLRGVTGRAFHVLGPDEMYTNPGDTFTYVKDFGAGNRTVLVADSADPYSTFTATGKFSSSSLGPCGLSQGVFSGPGNVTVSYSFSSQTSASILISSPALNIQGRAFGVLGTDSSGRDVWSQFVYGARVSLLVGLVASLIAVIVGTLVGVAAGYYGGFLDELLMRFTDFMLILPFLPLILVVITIISVGNIAFPLGIEFLIILVIALFSWEGIARVIRSQVLTIKSRQFVEASKALGSNERHIVWKHILPNVTGLIYANLALTVPGAILTEAAVTFLGFGDPSIVSWGSMVTNADSGLSLSTSFVWWWFLPPGFAIALLSMAFLFVGFALDSVLNPRLRRR